MTDDQITQAVNKWIDEHWNPELSLQDWREILVEGGWATPHWPSQYFQRFTPLFRIANLLLPIAHNPVIRASPQLGIGQHPG